MADAAALSVLIYRKTADILAKLTDDQLNALLDGTGDLAFVSAETTVRAAKSASSSPRSTKAAKPGLDELADRVVNSTDRDEVERYLEETKSITKDDLMAIGEKFSFTLQKGLTRPRMIKKLVDSVIGSRSDFNTVLGPSHQR